MSRSQEPLLTPVNRADSEASDEERIAEEDALLAGQNTRKSRAGDSTARVVRKQWQEVGLFVWAVLASAAVIVLAVLYQHRLSEQQQPPHKGGDDGIPSGKRNLIFMVSDGMGPTSLALTRSWRQYTEQLPYDETLVLDEYLIGQSRTRSSSSLVTDSAAGATAFSCGQKSYNGAISMLPDFSPCGSVMEAAKRMGYTTGLVVTTRITDATPAVFASHVRRREMEDEIALQLVGEEHPLGRMVDLMIGGGRCHFLPNSTGSASCRLDDVDVVSLADEKGWKYVDSKRDFENLEAKVELPLMALVARGDLPYEIDRVHEEEYPSLETMTKKALDVLSAATEDEDEGFFVMIEGSRIDHAGHANDPAAQVHEVLAYDRAMAAVLDFIKDSRTPTLMVATSDHETGGLATARQLHRAYPKYQWFPGVLANASHSASRTAGDYFHYIRSQSENPEGSKDEMAFLTMLVAQNLGIHDASEDELSSVMENREIAAYYFADMISRRAQTGWSTHGHSAADVNIYSSDPGMAADLVGNHENTDVGRFLRRFLGVEEEVEKVTLELKDHMRILGASGSEEAWLGSIPSTEERLDGQDHLDRYHGDHRRRGTNGCGFCGLSH